MSSTDQVRPLSAEEMALLRRKVLAIISTGLLGLDGDVPRLLATLDAAQARVAVLEQERATLWQFAVGVAGSVTRDQVDDVYARLPLEWRERLLAEARAALGVAVRDDDQPPALTPHTGKVTGYRTGLAGDGGTEGTGE